jgi:hypothetical protein
MAQRLNGAELLVTFLDPVDSGMRRSVAPCVTSAEWRTTALFFGNLPTLCGLCCSLGAITVPQQRE